MSVGVRELVQSFYTHLWNRQDRSRLPALLSDDFTFRGSLGLTKTGPSEFWDYVELVVGALGDYRCDIDDIVVEGDRAFARMTFSGVHRGQFLGVEASGRRISWAGAAMFTAANGRLQDLWVLGDVDGLRSQLNGEPE